MTATRSTLSPSRAKAKRQAAERRAETAARRSSQKTRSQRCILRVVERVATTRQVDWNAILSTERGCRKISGARGLAMALCAALDVPHFLIARAFSRSWASVYSAEVRCSALYHQDPAFRQEWDSHIKACSEEAAS
ncbi:MAG: hypothetical protein EOP88_10370 [Verrucomicrobiaceae bacterium]|nr:MAG: hypothetical protein EOP88_10370 [Verrucomicrobiaceae bacterium]